MENNVILNMEQWNKLLNTLDRIATALEKNTTENNTEEIQQDTFFNMYK